MRFLKNLILVLFLVSWGGIAAAENGATFLVYPSEDLTGETDWFNVMQAFEDAKAAGAGSSVELAAGTFYIPRPLQVANFSGTLRGVGKGKTILRNAPGILFGLLEPPLEPMPAFMVFWLDGMDPSSETFWPANQIQDLTLSGFTILIDGPSERWYSHCEPAHPGWQFINFIDVRGRWTGLQHGIWDMHPDDIMEQALVNIMFEHLELIGNNGYGNNGTQVWGEGVTFACGDGPAFDWAYNKLISGTHVVEDCSYDSVSNAIAFYDLVDSTVLVGGTPDSGVTVRNSFQPLLLWDLSNSSVHASHIDSTDSLGVALYNGIDTALYGLPEIRLPEPSDYVFRHNRIRQRAGSESASFDLWNLAGYFGRALGGVDISHNYIHSVDHIFPFGPILGDFVDGAVITNNRITGRGDTAIAIEPFGNPGRDWVLVGNNLQGFESTPYPEQILLGPETSNCIVVGGSNKTNVFDLGTDNHIVGVSNSGWARELPLGIRISEAIQLRNKR
jgi:hypothetical protein